MITHVYIFANGMVMVFDENGHQMPEYQGTKEDALPRIREVYDGPIEGEHEPLEWR